ncbi:MAG: hypothetical protein PHF90_06750 [Methanocorpusculum sp.]|nr:hypothetical protein [Methanocorpusculum sp.]
MRFTFWIVLGLLIFGGVTTMIADTGIYDVGYLSPESPFDEETTTQLTESTESFETNPMGGITALPTMIKTVLGGVLAVITILPLLLSMGFPIGLAMIFQGGIWFIYVIELFLWLKGISL